MDGNDRERDLCSAVVGSFRFTTQEEMDARTTEVAGWRTSGEPLPLDEYIRRCVALDADLPRSGDANVLAAATVASLELLEPPPPEIRKYHEAAVDYYREWLEDGTQPVAGWTMTYLCQQQERLAPEVREALAQGSCR